MANMFTFLQDWNNYEERKVARTTTGGLTISTVFTSDHGWETAILDGAGVCPVQRYPDEAQALLGHAMWCRRAPALTSVTRLGSELFGVPDKVVVLQRKEPPL